MTTQLVRFLGGPLDGEEVLRPYGQLEVWAGTNPFDVAYYVLDTRSTDVHDGPIIFRVVE